MAPLYGTCAHARGHALCILCPLDLLDHRTGYRANETGSVLGYCCAQPQQLKNINTDPFTLTHQLAMRGKGITCFLQ